VWEEEDTRIVCVCVFVCQEIFTRKRCELCEATADRHGKLGAVGKSWRSGF